MGNCSRRHHADAAENPDAEPEAEEPMSPMTPLGEPCPSWGHSMRRGDALIEANRGKRTWSSGGEKKEEEEEEEEEAEGES